MGLHNYGANFALDRLLGSGSPATVYIALLLSEPDASDNGAAIDECSGGSYARVAVTNDATNWPAASSGTKSNGTTISFPSPSASWGLVKYFAILDSATLGAGNVIGSGKLFNARTIVTGTAPYFNNGNLTVKAA